MACVSRCPKVANGSWFSMLSNNVFRDPLRAMMHLHLSIEDSWVSDSH